MVDRFALMQKAQAEGEAENMDPDFVKKVKGNHLLPSFPDKYQAIKKTELYRFGA